MAAQPEVPVEATRPSPPSLPRRHWQVKSTLSGLPEADAAAPRSKKPYVRLPRAPLVLTDWRPYTLGGTDEPKFPGFDDGPAKDKAETSIAQKFHDNGGFRRAIVLFKAPPCFRPCAVGEEGTPKAVIRVLLGPLGLEANTLGVVMRDLSVFEAADIKGPTGNVHAYAVTSKPWGGASGGASAAPKA